MNNSKFKIILSLLLILTNALPYSLSADANVLLSPKSQFLKKQSFSSDVSGIVFLRIFNIHGILNEVYKRYISEQNKSNGFYIEITGGFNGGVGKSTLGTTLHNFFASILDKKNIVEVDSDKVMSQFLPIINKSLSEGKFVIGSLHGHTNDIKVNLRIYVFTDPITNIYFVFKRIRAHIDSGQIDHAIGRIILELPFFFLTLPFSMLKDMLDVFLFRKNDVYFFNSKICSIFPKIAVKMPLNLKVFNGINFHSFRKSA